MSNVPHSFNTLPAKPQYLAKIRKVLSKFGDLSEKDLIDHTGLTKTQMLCSLAELIRLREVEKNVKDKNYCLTKSVES